MTRTRWFLPRRPEGRRAGAALVTIAALVAAVLPPAAPAATEERRRPAAEAPHRGADERQGISGALRGGGEDLVADARRSLRRAVPGAARWLIALSIAGGILVVLRVRARTRRDIRRFAIIPFQGDDATPDQVRRLLESWHQQMLERGSDRPRRGQPALALELVMEPDGQGGFEARMLIAAPARSIGALEGSLRACYPNARLEPRESPPPEPAAIVRLKKRELFIQALAAARDDESVTVDAVLNAMAAVQAPCVVQLTLTPTPASFDLYARHLFRARERKAGRRRSRNRADPGQSSELLSHEFEAGLQIQNRPLFFTEIRVGGPSGRACKGIAGVLRGETGDQNRLVTVPVYRWGRLGLYRERLRRAWGNPFPGWRRGVLSSSELTGLWRLPTAGLASVSLSRSAVPRLNAPTAVSRDPTHAILRDEQGPVGILPRDKSDGLGLIGGQKTGKTSALCQTVRVDGSDPTCAMVVLMPKPGDALKALSMVPPGRTVHYLDFEAPEFGINPLMSAGDAAMVADKVVEAFRDINMEGDIRGSSDRFLRQAAQAAIGAVRAGAIEGPPTLWHMYRILLPSEEEFREQVVNAIYGDSRFTDTATFFGRDLPNDLRDALVNTTSKLDAPRNKILRLMVESLDKVLRHPRQLDLDAVVRNREVLIVDGKMGTFGADNCRVMMQFILNMLYGTLQRQQQLPEDQRVRVAVKVDEAHLILNDSFADALATLRSGGLEVVAAWQYGEQIQDPKIRAGMMSLLRQRCMFSMGETEDARRMSEITMSVYTDMIRADPESRSRLRIAPETIINLPNHHAVCTWISSGARAPGFVAQTIPMVEDPAVIEHHQHAQRERGGFVPDRLPHPIPSVDAGDSAPLAGVGVVGSAGEPAVDESAVRGFDPTAEVIARPNDRPAERPPAQGAPETFTELDFDGVTGVAWDDLEILPPVRRHKPTRRELEILSALWEHRHLLASQIHRRWWSDSSLRACQQALSRMAKAGWVKRFRFTSPVPHQRIYCLTKDGFELAQAHTSSRGPYIDPGATWREAPSTDPRAVLRDLHANAWVMGLQTMAPKAVRKWRGPAASRVAPPRTRGRGRGEWQDVTPDQIPMGGSRRLRDPSLEVLQPVQPAATVEMRAGLPGDLVRFDLLVELERGKGAAYNEERPKRYDMLIAGWFRMVERYTALGLPPVVVFVYEDEKQALAAVRTADRVVTTRVAEAGVPEAEWPCPSRRQMLWVCERDIHERRLDAWALPELPPGMRVRLEGKGAQKCRPRRVQIVDPRLLELAAAFESGDPVPAG